MQEILLPLADVATPNLPEAEEIVGFKLDTEEAIKKAGDIFINEIGSKGVVIKGGHIEDKILPKIIYLQRWLRGI